MARWTIGRMMIEIAGIAVCLAGLIGLFKMEWRRSTGQYPSCQRNIRNVTLAILGYHSSKGQFPTGTWPNPALPPEKRLSWYAAISPYLDYAGLYQAINKDQSWDDPSQQLVAEMKIGVLRCPQVRQTTTPWFPATYIGIAGLGTDAPFLDTTHPRAGVFGYDRRVTLADLKDGAANTMMLAESERVRNSWLSGGPATVRGLDTADLPYLGRDRQFGGHHSKPGAYVAFADGSVRFISDTIDPKVFEAISTIAGGETISPPPSSW